MASKGITENGKKSFRKTMIKYAIPVLLIAVLVLVVVVKQKGNKADVPDENNIIEEQKQAVTIKPNADQYKNKLIASSDNYEMYLDGPTLSVTIKNKKTGAILESTVKHEDEKSNKQWKGFMQSGVVLTLIEGQNDTIQLDLINNNPQIMIEDTKDGVHAYVGFPEKGISFELLISLEEDAFTVRIPDSSIVENSNSYIGTISVLPFLGYSHLGDKEGYMFIPDGNGALIYLNDKEGKLTGGYSEMIYGNDIGFKDSETVSLLWEELQTVNETEKILAPIYGMVHTDDQIGYLGIVEDGDERASIEAYPNGVTLNYNRIYSKFLKRKVYKQPTSESGSGTLPQVERARTPYDIQVRYCLVSEEQANYTGLALEYRDYLMEQGLTAKDTGYKTRIDFLGTEREEWLVFKKKVTLTTVEDIRNIYKELKEEGITDILSIYKGWQNGGLNQLPITKYKADSAIGGTSDLTEFMKEAKKEGTQLYLYQDALRINPDENNTTFNVVKRVDKRLYEEYTYMDVYKKFLYLLPSKSSSYINKVKSGLQEQGITSLSLAGITNMLYSYSYAGKYYTRTDTMDSYKATIAKLDEELDLALEQPYAYLWLNADSFLDMPVGTSSYNYTDEEIPFLSIVLKGILPMYSEYMNFEASKQEFFLQLIEMGIYPSFYITQEDSAKLIYTNSSDLFSSKFDIYKSEIIKYASELKEINDLVKGSMITSHERLDQDITVVTYDNNVKIYINYSDVDQTVDGYTVEAMSYKVGEAK